MEKANANALYLKAIQWLIDNGRENADATCPSFQIIMDVFDVNPSIMSDDMRRVQHNRNKETRSDRLLKCKRDECTTNADLQALGGCALDMVSDPGPYGEKNEDRIKIELYLTHRQIELLRNILSDFTDREMVEVNLQVVNYLLDISYKKQ